MRLTQVPSLNLNNVFPIELVYGEFFLQPARAPSVDPMCIKTLREDLDTPFGVCPRTTERQI